MPISRSATRVAGTLAGQTVAVSQQSEGDLVHAETFTISGTGFGTRPDYNESSHTWEGHEHIHWCFQDYGTGLETLGWGKVGSAPSEITRESGGVSQSGYFSRVVNSGGGVSRGMLRTSGSGSPVPTTLQGWMCFKTRFDADGKVMRHAQPGFTDNFYMGGIGWYREGGDWRDSGSGITAYYQNVGPDGTSWKRIEVWLNPTSNPGAATPVSPNSRLWIDGTAVEHWSDLDTVYVPLCNTGDTARSCEWSLPNSVDPGGTADHTDIYIDFTAARVEVTVGSDTEIQLVTAWSDTSITCAFNKGELSSGAGTVKVYNASNSLIHSASVTVA